MLKQVKKRMQCNPNDYLRLNLRHPSLDSEIWYEFTQCKNLNEATILDKVQAVQQSKKEFTITDGSAEFELFHVKYPQGSGGQSVKHLHSNKEKFKKGKRSVLKIENLGDHLCLPRAIVVARLHSQRPTDPLELPGWKKQWDRIKRKDILSPQQKKQALELMKQAQCDPHLPCGPEEWNKLQEGTRLAPQMVVAFIVLIVKVILKARFVTTDIYNPAVERKRKTIQNLVQVNPFQEAITFASTANLAYRRGFMPQDSVAIIPNLGYDPARQFSMKACRWLAWMSRDGPVIRHAKNGGEINLGPYTVDGYDPESNTVYEFYGCYWHGCPKCHPELENENHPHRIDCTYGTLYEETLIREHHLREQGYQVVSIWEHDFDMEMKKNSDLRGFVDYLNFQDPLNPREALYGGRTNATRLFCTEGDMRYVDVCSLYPFVLKYKPFPMGHPEIIAENFEEISNYFGLIQCQVLPPRGLYHPVLPYRNGGKLLFPLCRTCAQELCQDPHYRCQHSEAERCITGTWVTVELQKAIECGYELKKIYEVWHFPQKSQDLFRSYIDTFLKIKQEASGYPPDCETEEQQSAYIHDIFERERLMLNPLEIEKNPVKRTIAKLFLNCLWGKFAQRLQLPKIEYLSEEEQLTKMLQDSTLEVKGIELLNNVNKPECDLILINYLEKQDFIEDCPFGNVVLAAFTTAHARLHLYDTLEKLGDRALYFDTDSIIYQHVEGEYNPTIVNSLGGWTDELEGSHITKFMSGGPKNYAFETDTGKSVQKVKGITLNHRASQIVTMKALEKMIFKELDEVTVTYPHKIQRTKRHELLTKRFTKKYQIVYDKRQIINDFKTLPFGY
ncbi:uncharacterized protein LOC128162281 [Crassostrea angulata]|uniref:uncharacterized protein LOC128162281 n=1 Tax=Magallana angulata TaxID=2784310 RepID=UPI0022B1D9A7|nr:uncharacterized protein LOC128162281 [Crassostrea angulata]